MPIKVTVHSRLEIEGASPEVDKQLREACTHVNPDYGKKRALGHWTGDTPRNIQTWERAPGGSLLLPRGKTADVRAVAAAAGERLIFIDRRLSVPAQWPEFRVDPSDSSAAVRPYQGRAEEACIAREQGIVRAPTGSGKTLIALSLLGKLGQRALVVMRDRQLLEQWVLRAGRHFGMGSPALGVVQGGKKRRVGECLTLALQQTLWSKTFPLAEFAQEFGCVAVDEVQLAAARTVQQTVEVFPARYRFGFSADESRKDRKEFLTYDLFGDVLYEVTRAEVEEDGYTCPVIVRLVPTEFAANWYRDAPPEERDFGKLLDEMIANEERGRLLRRVIGELVTAGQTPALVFTHRREHASRLSNELLADGLTCGLMMGGTESSAAFLESRDLLDRGKLPVAVGTFNAIGTGIDIPSVRAGVVSTPLGANRQFFGQVRGRICRAAKGKTVGYLYYLWDRDVFPHAPRNLIDWNDGRVEVFDGRSWVESDTRGQAA